VRPEDIERAQNLLDQFKQAQEFLSYILTGDYDIVDVQGTRLSSIIEEPEPHHRIRTAIVQELATHLHQIIDDLNELGVDTSQMKVLTEIVE
jgi:hypothetical protein